MKCIRKSVRWIVKKTYSFHCFCHFFAVHHCTSRSIIRTQRFICLFEFRLNSVFVICLFVSFFSLFFSLSLVFMFDWILVSFHFVHTLETNLSVALSTCSLNAVVAVTMSTQKSSLMFSLSLSNARTLSLSAALKIRVLSSLQTFEQNDEKKAHHITTHTSIQHCGCFFSSSSSLLVVCVFSLCAMRDILATSRFRFVHSIVRGRSCVVCGFTRNCFNE